MQLPKWVALNAVMNTDARADGYMLLQRQPAVHNSGSPHAARLVVCRVFLHVASQLWQKCRQ